MYCWFCISSTHVAESSIRAIFACMLTGQAAGTAAGIAVRDRVPPEKADVKKIQESLRNQGVRL